MHKRVEVAAAVLLSASCSDEEPPERPLTTMGSAAMEFPTIPEEQEGETAIGQWSPCLMHGQSDCLDVEECVRGGLDAFAVCMRDCVSVDDCQDGFGSVVTCSDFEGGNRCVLNCQTAADCPPQMACMLSACVWSRQPTLDLTSGAQATP